MRKKLVTLTLAVLLGCSHSSRAAVITKWLLGNQTTVLSTELNSLGNNAFTAASGTINNTVAGGTGDGYTLCDVEGVFVFAAAPTANTGVTVWFLMTSDGSNFENAPTASITLGRLPDVVLPVTAGQTGTRVVVRTLCPWGNFRALAKNDGTGQSMAASANTIKVRFVTPEGM